MRGGLYVGLGVGFFFFFFGSTDSEIVYYVTIK